MTIEDGAQTRQQLEERRQKMERIKENKLDSLKQANIPDYLMHDLKKRKVTV